MKTCKHAQSSGRQGVRVCGRPATFICCPFTGEEKHIRMPFCDEHAIGEPVEIIEAPNARP